jgi:ribulose-phosphate 3-epimerase
MSVNPGFGGQTFIPHSLDKIRATRELLQHAKQDASIGVDGGVDLANAAELVAAGATILVAGAAIFNTPNPTEAARAIKRAAAPVAR